MKTTWFTYLVICGQFLQVTILGFTAGSEFVGVLLGFAGAAIGIVAQQFTTYIGT
jgi:hypothetical protein